MSQMPPPDSPVEPAAGPAAGPAVDMARTPDLSPLLTPSAVAVVGASRSPGKVGAVVLANLLAAGYKGAVHPVNPAAAAANDGQGMELCGLPALASIAELPQGLDLAVVCLPQARVLQAVRQLAARGVRACVVLAAGFRESGRLGFEAETELSHIARQAGMILLGPNSLGLVNTAVGLNVTFATGQPRPGGVAFFSQSGAMCVAVLDWAAGQGLGFSTFVSLGNKAMVDEAAVLRHLRGDEHTRVILGYCESVEDGTDFLDAARAVAGEKPLVMLKAGTTSAGARAVSAHTGSVSGSPAAYRAAFRQAGALTVERVESLFGIAQALALQPPPKGPGLAILTNSGGPGILAADACARTRLTLPRPTQATLERLAQDLPGFASVYNPVDVLGDAGPERYRAALSALAADPHVHALLVLLTPTASADVEATARAIIEAARGPEGLLPDGSRKPFAACFMGRGAVRRGRELLLDAGIPCYEFPEAAVEALDALYGLERRRHGEEATACPLPGTAYSPGGPDPCLGAWDDTAGEIVADARAKGLPELGGIPALEAAHAAGLPVLTTGLARTSAEAVRLAVGEIGLPVTLRLSTPDPGFLEEAVGAPSLPPPGLASPGLAGFGMDGMACDSEEGCAEYVLGDRAGNPVGQITGLADAEAVRRAFLTLTGRAARLRPEAYVTGCLVQATPKLSGGPGGTGQDARGFELSVGFTRDPQFGPLLSFGLRGIASELLGDVAHRLAPLTPADAREMLREVRFYPLLRGARGGTAVSLEALERLLLGVSRMALRLPLLMGARFSPVLAGPGGVFIAGARLTLG